MVQNLVQLPETANIIINGFQLYIENHRIWSGYLLEWSLEIMNQHVWNQAVAEMQSAGISFEAFVETCADEIDSNYMVQIALLKSHYGIMRTWGKWRRFTKSDAGIEFARIFTDKIRDCSDWKEFHEHMHSQSKFQKYMGKKAEWGTL